MLCSSCEFLRCIVWASQTDSKVIHELIKWLIYCFLSNARPYEPVISSPSCTILDNISQKRKREKEAAELPACFRPSICLPQLFHRWQEQKGQQDWSYSIHFIANMICLNGEAKAKTFLCGRAPPLATTNSHGTVSPQRQTFSYRSSMNSTKCFKTECVAVGLEARHMCSQSCKWNLPDLISHTANPQNSAHSNKVQQHWFKYLISFYFSSGFICYSAQQHTGNCGKI